jgi:hypothetical protein
VLLTVAGGIQKKPKAGSNGDNGLSTSSPGQSPAQSSATPGASRGGGRRGGQMNGGGRHTEGPPKDELEVSAQFYSVHEHRTVGIVSMAYTGPSTDVAMAAFADKLRVELPAAQCQGWKPDVKVDVDRVRAVKPVN